MAMNGLKPPQELDLSAGSNIALNWKKFKKAWSNYECAMELNKKSVNVRLATFLHVIGDAGVEKFESFEIDVDDDNEDKMKIVLQRFDDDCKPRTNLLNERYNFLKRKQERNEDVDQYVTQLRLLAGTCEYANAEEAIRNQLVLNMKDDIAREKILDKAQFEGKVPDLNQVVNMVKNYESRKQQQKNWNSMDSESETLSKLQEEIKILRKTEKKVTDEWIKSCKSCGYDHKKNNCPAYDKSCHNCNKKNHFSTVCKNKVSMKNSKDVKQITEEEAIYTSKMNDQEYQLNTLNNNRKYDRNISSKDYIIFNINNVPCKFLIDSGATCNILPLNLVKKMKKCDRLVCGDKKTKLTLFDGSMIKSIGSSVFTCTRNGKQYDIEFQIVDANVSALLGTLTCKRLNILKILDSDDCYTLRLNEGITEETLEKENKDIFCGIGNIGNKCKIEVDRSVKPVVHTQRRVPYALREKLRSHLNDLEEQGIIQKIDEPTDWVSSMVTVTKDDGSIRICLDPTDLNKAIKRPHFPLPVVEEVMTKLKGAKIFSTLDAKSGYWQVQLDNESQKLTTFNTPFGRYKYLRLPFGIKSASEEFQMRLLEALDGIEGIAIVADDILVYGVGTTDEQAERNHDEVMHNVLKRCRERNLKLNQNKIKLKKKQIRFIGHIITPDGVKADPDKRLAIMEMKSPKNVKELRRFLEESEKIEIEKINYLSKFLPQLSAETESLRTLLSKNSMWCWV